MVNIVPNWTEVVGRVRAISPHESLKGYSKIILDVKSTSDVKGFRNLMTDKDMSEVSAIISDEALAEKKIKEGMNIVCHIRLTQNRENFVNPESLQKST
jgi:hypothetical protein